MVYSPMLETLRKTIKQKPPFCTGVVPVGDSAVFCFKKEGNDATWIDLARATEAELQALTEACEPATFGLNTEDVLDESYRKAGKMDSDNFMTRFDINGLRIVDYVHEQLMDAADDDKVIRAERYKLNVYGKGSFFKSHKDTPRGETMFGSLVVVFPAAHEGGALVLRHNNRQWTFDAAALTKSEEQPSIAYIAFYSDVDHEVTLVTSGYRVTLTYNLFFEEKSQSQETLPESIKPVVPDDDDLEAALSAALTNPDFLPQGGYLGFGLSYKYPMSQGHTPSTTVLKGSDAVIYRACEKLSLEPSLYVVYNDGHLYLVPAKNTLDDGVHEDIGRALCDEFGGRIIHEFGYPYLGYDKLHAIRLAWVTPLTDYSRFKSDYLLCAPEDAYYGNEPPETLIYGDLCLAVEVGPYGDRQAGCEYVKDSKLEILKDNSG